MAKSCDSTITGRDDVLITGYHIFHDLKGKKYRNRHKQKAIKDYWMCLQVVNHAERRVRMY